MVSSKILFILTSVALAAATPVQLSAGQLEKRSKYTDDMTAIGRALFNIKTEVKAWQEGLTADPILTAFDALNKAIKTATDNANSDPRPFNDADGGAIAHYISLTTPGYVTRISDPLSFKVDSFDTPTKKSMHDKAVAAKIGFDSLCKRLEARMRGELLNQLDNGCYQVDFNLDDLASKLQ
ncbi:hypothetical protein Tdes44962_MAKER09522 [Teratosphaeria destructans]|uniref:Uncharacterized protein n=1 Tax=Teratosphaeria destructans TaxID=418781 RepID=A0A9W7W2L4_9PEZI|nr:hypothetical protein Tdes44962_MAKER09522 [Teratosphaeria destructans]